MRKDLDKQDHFVTDTDALRDSGEYFLEKQNEEKRIEVKNWVTVRKPVPPTSAATDYQLLKHSDSCADPAIGRREGNGQDSYIDVVALSCPQLILALR